MTDDESRQCVLCGKRLREPTQEDPVIDVGNGLKYGSFEHSRSDANLAHVDCAKSHSDAPGSPDEPPLPTDALDRAADQLDHACDAESRREQVSTVRETVAALRTWAEEHDVAVPLVGLDESDERIDRLEALARERWNEQWGLKTHRFADGMRNCYAFRTRGSDEQERLYLQDDGRISYQYVRIEQERAVEVLDFEIVDEQE